VLGAKEQLHYREVVGRTDRLSKSHSAQARLGGLRRMLLPWGSGHTWPISLLVVHRLPQHTITLCKRLLDLLARKVQDRQAGSRQVRRHDSGIT
jgi:hypothetical protein